MAKNLGRLADHATRSDFADRVRLSFTAAALKALDGTGNNEERANFAMAVLRGDIPAHVVVTAALASMAETAPDPAPGDKGKPLEIPDDWIDGAMRPGGDISKGVFAKLAIAHMRKAGPEV
jgi:hypothetical protein